MKIVTLSLIAILCSIHLHAQIEEKPDRSLTGYWTGAVVRSGNSIQNMTAEIYKQGDSLVIEVSIPDWVYYPPKVSKFSFNKDNAVQFETYYGDAKMLIDSTYLEMIGTINDATPPYQFHLKKSLKPYSPKIVSKDIEVENEGANVNGTLYYRADLGDTMPTAILLHGRGCGTRRWKQSRAMKLAEYGLAAFVYDKRGSKASRYPCEEATHDQNVADVSKMVAVLAKEKIVDKKRIGLVSSSAGGWIAPHVTQVSDIPIAFLITLVGPTTSVKEQQIDGLIAFMEDANYSEKAIKEATEYIELMFTKGDYDQTYSKMQELLVAAKENGWNEFLVEGDYADSPEAIADMWVQRFSYDPAEALMNFDNPYLAVFAENDPIVPYKKQIERLKELKSKAPTMDVTTKTIPSAFHNLEHGPEIRNLGLDPISNQPSYYFKYDRVAYGTVTYIIQFLNENKLL